MIVFPLFLFFAVGTPLIAFVLITRDHQLMVPAEGALDTAKRVRGESALRGTVVGWSTIWPMVRVESVRLVRHPAVYLVAAPFAVLSLSSQLLSGSVHHFERTDVDLIILLVPYGWGALIASNLSTLRGRRWRSEELLATTPTPPRSRTLAHLLATIALVPGAVVLLAVGYGSAVVWGHTIGTPRPWVLVTAVLIVVGGGFVGVAVARWLPRPVFGWVAVIATIVLQVNFGALDPRWRWLHFSMYGNESINYPSLAPDHHAVHAAYLLGGLLLVAAIAIARDGFDRNSAALSLAAIGLLVVSGFVQTAPPSAAEAETFARRFEDPGAGQVCTPRTGYTMCSDAAYVEFANYWSEPIEGVLRRIPAEAAPQGLVIRQRPMIEGRAYLPTEVAERVDPAIVWPDDNEVSVSNQWNLTSPEDDRGRDQFQLALAFRTASAVVGLPPDAWWAQSMRGSAAWATIPLAETEQQRPVPSPFTQCIAADQARSVVATWLAAQATPGTRAELKRRAGEVVGRNQLDAPVAFDAVGTYHSILPGYLPEQGAVVLGADLAAAAALLERDDNAVAAMLADHWSEVSGVKGAAVTTADLLGWFDLDPVRARDIVVATTPAPDPEPHEEDITDPPVVAGSCPTSIP